MIAKKVFRQKCLQELKQIQKRGNYQKDKKIVCSLYHYIKAYNAQSILLYLPLKMEVNLYPLIVQLRKEKKQIYVPFMENDSFKMVRYRLPTMKKKFGIKEPSNSKQYRNKNIDIAIVPMVGIDATFRRVGFGKGMYDRFFEKRKKYIDKTIFIARELCYTKEVVTDAYDISADIIITG